MEFLPNFQNVKSPRTNVKPPLLKTLSWRFWVGHLNLSAFPWLYWKQLTGSFFEKGTKTATFLFIFNENSNMFLVAIRSEILRHPAFIGDTSQVTIYCANDEGRFKFWDAVHVCLLCRCKSVFPLNTPLRVSHIVSWKNTKPKLAQVKHALYLLSTIVLTQTIQNNEVWSKKP